MRSTWQLSPLCWPPYAEPRTLDYTLQRDGVTVPPRVWDHGRLVPPDEARKEWGVTDLRRCRCDDTAGVCIRCDGLGKYVEVYADYREYVRVIFGDRAPAGGRLPDDTPGPLIVFDHTPKDAPGSGGAQIILDL